jgi:hypothetical protein
MGIELAVEPKSGKQLEASGSGSRKAGAVAHAAEVVVAGAATEPCPKPLVALTAELVTILVPPVAAPAQGQVALVGERVPSAASDGCHRLG